MKNKFKGEPFKYSTCLLRKAEYAKITSEINNAYYEIYEDKRIAVHYSLDENGKYYMYYFENHGFDNYNIFEKIEF